MHTDGLQSWSRIQSWLLRDEYLDTLHVGIHQCAHIDNIFVFGTRRSLKDDENLHTNRNLTATADVRLQRTRVFG